MVADVMFSSSSAVVRRKDANLLKSMGEKPVLSVLVGVRACFAGGDVGSSIVSMEESESDDDLSSSCVVAGALGGAGVSVTGRGGRSGVLGGDGCFAGEVGSALSSTRISWMDGLRAE